MQVEDVNTEVHDEVLESGESLMMKRVWLKPHKKVQEPIQRRNIFKTMCKEKGKCCKFIIDNGSTDNLVSTDMVDKLGLRRIAHPTPYSELAIERESSDGK